jgi:RND family efflux transporter MFP subunit
LEEGHDRKWLTRERLARASRWLVPLLLTAPLALVLSPGLLSQPRKEEKPPPTLAAAPAMEAALESARLAEAPDSHEVAEASEPQPPAAIAPPDEATGLEPFPLEDEAIETVEASESATADSSSILDCIIEPSVEVEIGSPVLGLIESVHAERGDLVEAGQVLVELESGAEKAAAEVARTRASMRGTIQSREASLALGNRRLERASKLFEENALSADLREQSETEAELARLELQQARENQRLASLQHAQALELLKRRTIQSPISGIVVDRGMAPGEVVDDDDTILTVAQIDPLHVEVILPSALYGSIEPGMRAAVVPEFPGDQVHVASVTIVDRVIDAASGTFGVRLELPNPDHAIPGGLHCQVRFDAE